MKRSLTLAAACALTLIVARDAAAGSPGFWPFFWGGSVYTSNVRGLPPYFSLYPPVYYSVPVPRTYGYSPFAYPIGSPTPEVTLSDAPPKVMINPYVPRSQPMNSSTDKTAGGPLTIVNPFVNQQPALAQTND